MLLVHICIYVCKSTVVNRVVAWDILTLVGPAVLAGPVSALTFLFLALVFGVKRDHWLRPDLSLITAGVRHGIIHIYCLGVGRWMSLKGGGADRDGKAQSNHMGRELI